MKPLWTCWLSPREEKEFVPLKKSVLFKVFQMDQSKKMRTILNQWQQHSSPTTNTPAWATTTMALSQSPKLSLECPCTLSKCNILSHNNNFRTLWEDRVHATSKHLKCRFKIYKHLCNPTNRTWLITYNNSPCSFPQWDPLDCET